MRINPVNILFSSILFSFIFVSPLSLLSLSLTALMFSAAGYASDSKEKSWDCAKSDLLDHQCHFAAEKDSIDLSASTIKIAHGGRFSLTENPIPGKDVEWESAKVIKLGSHLFLDLQMWDAPVGSTEAQSLRWITFELSAGRLHKLGDEIVQERSKNEESPAIQEFVQTDRDDFGLNVDSRGQIIWHHKNKSKAIK